jgi:Rrf2 family protein
MLEIGLQNSEKGVYQKDIAEKQDISVKYLDHIIQALKSSMLICNVKGKKSGYILYRKPEEITVYDIYQAFEPEICVVNCFSNRESCNRSGECSAQSIYGELNQMIINFFKSISLKDLIDRQEILDLSPSASPPIRNL